MDKSWWYHEAQICAAKGWTHMAELCAAIANDNDASVPPKLSPRQRAEQELARRAQQVRREFSRGGKLHYVAKPKGN